MIKNAHMEVIVVKSNKRGRLAVKIPIQIIGIVAAIMIIICITLSIVLTNVMNDTIKSEITHINEVNANKAQVYLDNMHTVSKIISLEVARYSDLEPDVANKALISSLNGILDDKNIFAVAYGFEPNEYFKDTPDGKSYYAFRDGDSIKMDILNNYSVYSTGDFYATTKKTMSTHITEPYAYELTTGETLWMISLSNPILDENGKFIGVVTCDILTSTISDLNYDLGGYEESYNYILTNAGTYIAHSSDKELVGTTYDSTSESGKSIMDSVVKGVSVNEEGINSIYGGKALVLHKPIHVEGTDSTWSSGLIVSKKSITAIVVSVIAVVAVIALIGLIIIAVFTYFILRKSLKPINTIMKLADKMKHGILNSDEEIEIKTNDELGELAQIFKDTSNILNDYVTDIAFVLDNISLGNLQVLIYNIN